MRIEDSENEDGQSIAEDREEHEQRRQERYARVEDDRRAMSYVPPPELRCARLCPAGHAMTVTRVCRRGWCDGCGRTRKVSRHA